MLVILLKFLFVPRKAALVLLLCLSAASPHPATADSSSPLFDHQLIIIGETHLHAESMQWFLSAISSYVQNGQCLHVALEIDSSQQAALQAAVSGKASIAAVQINPFINSPSYRRLLAGLTNLVKGRHCLQVHAVDMPQSAHAKREQWMADRLAGIEGGAPIVALLGNLHALKKVAWLPGSQAEPFLAERLQTRGMDLFSVIQSWPAGECRERLPSLVAADRPKAGEALRHILAPVTANPPANPYAAIDAALVWECP